MSTHDVTLAWAQVLVEKQTESGQVAAELAVQVVVEWKVLKLVLALVQPQSQLKP